MTIRELMTAGDWRGAISIAAGHNNLGPHKEPIQRAWSAYTRPEFYREIGKDPKKLIAVGIAAMVDRFGDPSNNFKDGKYD